MEKKPTARIYGLLGYPVKHSFSPAMHNAAFNACGINARYTLFEVKPEELEGFFKEGSSIRDIDGESFVLGDISGLNVTIPHKESVLKYLNWKSFEVRFTEAANVVIFKENNFLRGFNTDGLGFHRHLTKDLRFSIKGKKVLIIGAGGAAKAVVSQLARKGAKSIIIYDVDKRKSTELAVKTQGKFENCMTSISESIEGLNIISADLLVNASPVGMKESDPCLLTPDMVHKNLFVYDLIYNPPETKLLKLAIEKGCKRVSNGLGMLLYQGMLSFTHFTGKSAPFKVMEQALSGETKKL